MKKSKSIGLLLLGSILFTPIANAKGNATVEFRSDSTIEVGDTFTVEMMVTNIKDTYDGVVSMGGNLSFDENIIKYISSEATKVPYLFQINEEYNYKIAGLDFTLDNGIKKDTVVYTFTFEALRAGNTTVTLTNQKLTDSQSYIDADVKIGSITIVSTLEHEKETNIVITEDKEEGKQSVSDIKINKTSESSKNIEIKKMMKKENFDSNMKQLSDMVYKLIKLFK